MRSALAADPVEFPASWRSCSHSKGLAVPSARRELGWCEDGDACPVAMGHAVEVDLHGDRLVIGTMQRIAQVDNRYTNAGTSSSRKIVLAVTCTAIDSCTLRLRHTT
jgi:hypothetical protein